MKRIIAATSLALLFSGTALAETNLTYMMWGDPPEIAVWEKLVEKFHSANPDINVKVEVADWDSYWNKLRIQTAGGDAPDVFAMDAPIYPAWQSRGTLLNLQSYIDANPKSIEDLYKGPLSTYKLSDGYYGLPRDFQTIVMFYNKAKFDAAGVGYPTDSWTYADFKDAAKALTLDTDGDGKIDQWGVSTEVWDMEPFWGPIVYGYGGEVIDSDYSQTLMTKGKAKQAFEFIDSMVTQDHSIMSDEDLESYGYDGFQADVAAMTFSGHWVIPAYNDLAFEWGVAPFPKGPAKRATLVNSAGIVGSASTDHPDEVWKFISYVVSAEGQSILASLGFAIPVAESVATSATYLEQSSKGDHQLFADALSYAHVKPSFRAYEEWSGAVGDPLSLIWSGELTLDEALAEIEATADDTLGK